MESLEINQRVQIIVTVSDGRQKTFSSRIKRVYKDRITLQATEDMFVYSDFLKESDEIFITVFTPLGMISFDSIIINSIFEPEFMVEYAEDTVTVQRRQFLRISCQTKLVFDNDDGSTDITNTMDLSAGGVRFFSERHFEEGEKVYFRLFLPMQMDSVSAQGVVTTQKPVMPPNQHLLMFTKISQKDADRITKVCMDYEPPRELDKLEVELEIDLKEDIDEIQKLLQDEDLQLTENTTDAVKIEEDTDEQYI